MKIKNILKTQLVFFVLCVTNLYASTAISNQPKKPNVVLFFVDDMGYGELGCYGGKDLQTPNIDKIAANGVLCTSGYVTAPSCTPSRAGLMSGHYQQRFGHEMKPEKQFRNSFGFKRELKTMGNYLQAAGYKTGAIGKWDLGRQIADNPINRGFDFYYGHLIGARHYWPVKKGAAHMVVSRGPDTLVKESKYLTYQLTDGAIEFIDTYQQDPFFLYVAYNAPHVPFEAPEEAIAANGHIKNKKRRTYAGMITALDQSIGRVLEKLKKLGLEENTMILFISDNGAPVGAKSTAGYVDGNNGPLKKGKGSLYEGGIRVPFIVQWKEGNLPAGTTSDLPVSTLDLLPTFLTAAGAKPEQNMAGRNILPYLKETESEIHDSKPLFWRYNGWCAVRSGAWKWVSDPKTKTTGLFYLSDDSSEENNLIEKYPEKAAELKKLWSAWNKNNIAPLWQPKKMKFFRKYYGDEGMNVMEKNYN